MSEIMLRARELTKSFRTGQEGLQVLKGLHLEVRRGEFLAIRGASGVGKSTLLHLLGGLDRPDRGSLEVQLEDGGAAVDLSRMSDHALNRFRNEHVGFVFQFHHLLAEFDALENVFLPALVRGESLPAARTRAATLLTEFGLGQRLHHKPNQLSGGEAQRVAVARALINQPRLLLMDEPTGNLDRERSESIFDLLTTVHQTHGQTMIVVTHDETIAAKAQRTLHLVDGLLQSPAGE